MSKSNWEMPPSNWLGGFLVVRELLLYTKSNEDDDSSKESFLAKMNRQNLIARIQLVTMALNQFGPTLDCATAIQGDGKGFFNDITADVLAEKLVEATSMLGKSGTVWKFRSGEFGSMDFSEVPGPGDGDGDGDDGDTHSQN